MDLKIICLFIICICIVVGIIMSAKYLKTMLMWLVITLLLIGLIISISYLLLLINGTIR